MNRQSRKYMAWQTSQALYNQALKLHNRNNHNGNNHMIEQSFEASLKRNLEQQRKVLQEKLNQIDQIIHLVNTESSVAEFAELMQKFQQQPGQPQ